MTLVADPKAKETCRDALHFSRVTARNPHIWRTQRECCITSFEDVENGGRPHLNLVSVQRGSPEWRFEGRRTYGKLKGVLKDAVVLRDHLARWLHPVAGEIGPLEREISHIYALPR